MSVSATPPAHLPWDPLNSCPRRLTPRALAAPLPGSSLPPAGFIWQVPEAHSPPPLQVRGLKPCYSSLPSLPNLPSRGSPAALPPSGFSRQEAGAGLRSPGPPGSWGLAGIMGRRVGSAHLSAAPIARPRQTATRPFWQDLTAQVTTVLLKTLT